MKTWITIGMAVVTVIEYLMGSLTLLQMQLVLLGCGLFLSRRWYRPTQWDFVNWSPMVVSLFWVSGGAGGEWLVLFLLTLPLLGELFLAGGRIYATSPIPDGKALSMVLFMLGSVILVLELWHATEQLRAFHFLMAALCVEAIVKLARVVKDWFDAIPETP